MKIKYADCKVVDYWIYREIERLFSEVVEHMAPEARPDVQTLLDRVRDLLDYEKCTFALDYRPHVKSLEGFAHFLENLGRGAPGSGGVYTETHRAVHSRRLQGECLRLARRIREELIAG